MGQFKIKVMGASVIINNQTTKEILESVSIGDNITNYQGIAGKVIAVHKGVNCGMMQYDFYFDSGKPYTEYSFNKRPL
jgi:hypothetical protein